VEEKRTRSLITEAVFEEQGWTRDLANAKERLRLKAREEVAWRWGGAVPCNPDIDGIPHQTSEGLFTRWIRGEEIQFSQGVSLPGFYAQVRALLRGVGLGETETEALISAAISEEEKWQKKPTRAVERLVKSTQEAVGPDQNLLIGPEAAKVLEIKNRVIYTRWLEGGEIPVSGARARREFIAKAADWLRSVGVREDRVRTYLLERLFKEQGWDLHAMSAAGRLLLWAREEVALRYGGSLPSISDIDGVSQQNQQASLSRWLKGEDLSSQRGHAPGEFYEQVRALLRGLGGEEEKIERAITEAVFEQRGWGRETKTARERLLLAARKRVAPRFGGVLPAQLGIEGIPVQGPLAYLTRWLAGDDITALNRYFPHEFYSQVRIFLRELGVREGEADRLVREAVFEEQNWRQKAGTAPERLLLKAREGLALKFGGVLPVLHGLPEVFPNNSKSPLTRWLKGEQNGVAARYPAIFYSQVRHLLHGLGTSPEEIDSLILAAVFEEQGWKREAKTPEEILLRMAREKLALRYGGHLPAHFSIEGVSIQAPASLLTRWLRGEEIVLSESLLSQIRAFLIHEDFLSETDADRLFADLKKER